MTESIAVSRADTWLYRIGSAAAAAILLLIVLPGPVMVVNPIPTTIVGHFTQINGNGLVGLIDLDLPFAICEVALVFVYLGLFAALRRHNPFAAVAGLAAGVAGSILYIAVNPALSFLYLSDQYAAATSDAQRAAFLAAGEAVWAGYQGTAFAVAYILSGVAILVFSIAMLRSRVFNRWTAWIGLVDGVVMLVPPLPVLGAFGVTASYLSLLPLVVWTALVGWRLFQLSRHAALDQAPSTAVGRLTHAA